MAAGTTIAVDPGPGGRDRHREDPRRGEELTFEGDLAGERERPEPIVRDLSGGCQHAHHERQVEARPFLADVRGREVDDDSTERPRELGALNRRADPLTRVLDARAGEARDDEGGKPSTDVRLHGHEVPPDAEHRHPQDPPVHGRRTIPATTDTRGSDARPR